MLSYPDLEKLFSSADTLPQAPRSPLRLSSLLDMPDASPLEIESLILADPALTAGILKAAGSAAFGRMRPVTTVREAVMVLGFRALRVMAVALWTQALVCESKHSSLLDTARFAKNGSFVGHLASSLYARSHSRSSGLNWTPEEVYACGVLHNLGVGLLSLLAPIEFDAIYGLAKDHAVTFQQGFLMIYSHDLNELGAKAATTMGLPELFRLMIENIDHPANALDHEVALAHLQFSHFVAEDCGLGIGSWGVPYTPCESMNELVVVEQDALTDLVSIARKNLAILSAKCA